MIRELTGTFFSKKIIAFDTFACFPDTEYEPDKGRRLNFIRKAGTSQSISVEKMMEVLGHKGCDKNIDLIAGDITKTVPEYIDKHPELKISLLNLDTDIYEPAVAILEHLYPRIVNGGVLMIDDYGNFPGETKAVDEYFAGMNIKIRKFPFSLSPCYIVKESN